VNDASYLLEYYTDGVLVTRNETLVEGENVLSIVEQDGIGNETRVDYKVTLDTIPPAIIFTSTALTNQPFYTLTYTVEGASQAETLQLTEGDNSFTRSFTDPAGNAASETFVVTLDTVPPAVVLTSSDLTNQTSYPLTFTVDSVSQSEMVTLTEGLNTIQRQFQDAAQNTTSIDFLITLDTIPPLVTITSMTVTNDLNYTLTYTSDGVSVTRNETLAEGGNILTIVEQDAAGNETQTAFSVELDTIPPLVTVTSVTVTNDPNYILQYTADNVQHSVPVTLTEGLNILPIVEVDAADNQTSVNFQITLDTIPPVIQFTSADLVNDPNYTLLNCMAASPEIQFEG